MKLTFKQIEFIKTDLMNRGITSGELTDSILDHVCCAIENHSESDFDSAYRDVIDSFGINGLLKIQIETDLLLTIKKKTKMKIVMNVTGYIATILSTTGLLFFQMHWQGGAIMLILGIVLLNIGFLPMYFYDRYKKSHFIE